MAVPAWERGAGRILASARREEREDIAADVEALAHDPQRGETLGRVICPKCAEAIAAMIRAGGKRS